MGTPPFLDPFAFCILLYEAAGGIYDVGDEGH